MNRIEAIKERLRMINLHMTAPNIENYREDVEYLLSKLEIAEIAFDLILARVPGESDAQTVAKNARRQLRE